MEEATKGNQQELPITFEELKLKLYHPWRSSSNQSTNAMAAAQSLSFIPWTLRQSANITTATSEDISTFPNTTYLDLRRQQNRAFANDRLSKGNEQFFLDAAKADSLYQEGLDLVNDHIELLMAQAKLWIQRRNRPQAAKAQLEQILQLDPNHVAAKTLLDRLKREGAARQGIAARRLPQTRETSSAFQDVLMERNLAIHRSLLDAEDEEGTNEHADQVSSEQNNAKKKKKSKKRKSKKKSKHDRKKHDNEKKRKRKRKRKRYDSSSTDSASSSSDQSPVDSLAEKSGRGRRDHGRTYRQKRHRRRRYDSDSSSDPKADLVSPSSPRRGDDERNGCTNNDNRNSNDAKDGSSRNGDQSDNKHNARISMEVQDDEVSPSDRESSHRDDDKVC